VFHSVPLIEATTPYRMVKMDLKKMLALAMLALVALPSLTIVGADYYGEAGPAGAIERARIYLDKVMTSAEKTASGYPENHSIHGYLDEIYALLGKYEYEGPEILFQTGGSGIAEWSSDEYHSENRSAKLYVVNGTEDWAEVSIPVDIAIESFTALSFYEYIDDYDPNGFTVQVILGIDADGDDDFEADLAAWHQGPDNHTTTPLKGDTFIEFEFAANPTKKAWTERDALNDFSIWLPNATGDGFSTFGYGDFASFLAWLDEASDDSAIDKDMLVKEVILQIGGSGSWMDETAYVDDIEINGVPYDFEEREEEEGKAKYYLDQASYYLGENDTKSAARSLASARNILGRVNGLMRSMAKAHKVTRTEKFNRRIQGIKDKIERQKGPKNK